MEGGFAITSLGAHAKGRTSAQKKVARARMMSRRGWAGIHR